MTKETDRRRWERLALEGAVAVDDEGRELGHVLQVGGGGIGVHLNPDRRLDDWTPGRKMRVTVMEPASSGKLILMFSVRYLREGVLGLEFTS